MSKYGMNVKFTAVPGERNNLAQILLNAADSLQTVPECLIYAIHVTENEPDTVWVTEVWSSKVAHDASLQQEDTQAAIGRAKSLIAGIEAVQLTSLGGKGL
ncbi:putative quinol monooxygenase [Paenibacillus sp. J22TS3]|uniref:putative quinol monooxygenase n=1 Tax=Paenibacillus sp. J22TS3 TaxID=2807192 RepID=UPI001B296117|nr:putative quinol monooxygenase [Paenibacillus sp. J22TS3]GIP21630.1 hypothetical protein J22TS3_19050 [Paenibacillus sp. J22TS3]